jgi:hypothetical protein
MPKIHDEPSNVTNKKGAVIVDGPNGVDLSLTPEAAVKTGADLIENAADAKGDAEIEKDLAERKRNGEEPKP